MPTISRAEAVERLKQVVKVAHPDDLAEISNELFPEKVISEAFAQKNSATVVKRIVEHFMNGLEAEEIIDLWNVVFPHHQDVSYDDENQRLHYQENLLPSV